MARDAEDGSGLSWNSRWYLDLNQISRHTAWAHGIAAAYAVAGGLLVLAALLIAGWLLARRRSPRHVAAAVSAGAAAVLGFLLNQPLSVWINEPRPYRTLHHVLVLVARVQDPSMPSDHAIVAGAVATGILIYSWRLGLVATVFGLALAFDRVYVGAHYPADVMVGLVIGAAVALLLYRVARLPLTAFLALISRTPLRGLVLADSVRRDSRLPKADTET